MRDHLDHLGDTAIAVITFSPSTELPAHRQHLALPFPLLADPSRVIYHRFQLDRGALHRIWGPGTLRLYAQLLRRGRRLRRPTGDTRQLGGDFVIAPNGRLAAAFRPNAPDQRPPIDSLLAAVSDATR